MSTSGSEVGFTFLLNVCWRLLCRSFVITSLLYAVGALGQSSLFTYQGVLREGTNGASGLFDFSFRVFDQPTGGTQQGREVGKAGLQVDAGRFTTDLDFGPVFDGSPRWLEILVKKAGDLQPYTTLSPRQQFTTLPYAIHAETSAEFRGQVSDAQLSPNVARLDANQTFTGNVRFTSVSGNFVGDGTGLTNVTLPPGIALPETDAANLTNVLQASVNLHQVKRILNALNSPTNSVNLACMGDSVAWRYFGHMMLALERDWGENGTVFGNMPYYVASQETELVWRDSPNIKTFAGPDTNWFATYCEIPAGETRTYTNRNSGSGWYADRIDLFFIKHAAGGVFALQVSTNGGPYQTALTVNTLQPGPHGGGVTNLALPRNFYRYRLLGVSGTSRVIDTGVWDTRSGGARASWLFQGGISIHSFLAVSNIAVAILPSLNLHGVFLSLKDAQDIGTNNFAQTWPHFEGLLNQCFPKADIIYVGATPQIQSDAILHWQDKFMRQRALATGRAYYDCRTPFVSAESVINLQFADILGVHLTPSGAAVLAEWLLRDLGLSNSSLAGGRVVPAAWYLKASAALPSVKLAGPQGACFWNSNGIVYLLTARPDGTAWASTNRIGP